MKAVRNYSILFFSCLLLAGCSHSQSAEKYQQVEESVTSEEKGGESNDETEYQTDPSKDLQDQWLEYYIPDSHFYETTPQPFANGDAMLTLEILDAFSSKDPADGGEYFTTSKRMQHLKEVEEEDGRDTILFVKIRLTNPDKNAAQVCIGELDMYKRVPGLPEEKNEYSDQTIERIHDELDFDKPMTLGDMMYFVKIEAGKSLETTIACYVREEDLKEKLYMRCWGMGGAEWSVYNAGKNRREPSNDPNVRYVRVNVRE